MTKKKLLKQEGVTLLELLITISLMGLIFALGMYPMLSQITLFREERSEIALFDDANLAVNYIIKDAMKAEEAYNGQDPDGTTSSWVEFTIIRDPNDRPGSQEIIRYDRIDSNLRRLVDGSLDRVITNKLNGDPSFALLTNTTLHRLNCSISFQDTDITTRRDFEVMLRCKDARL